MEGLPKLPQTDKPRTLNERAMQLTRDLPVSDYPFSASPATPATPAQEPRVSTPVQSKEKEIIGPEMRGDPSRLTKQKTPEMLLAEQKIELEGMNLRE